MDDAHSNSREGRTNPKQIRLDHTIDIEFFVIQDIERHDFLLNKRTLVCQLLVASNEKSSLMIILRLNSATKLYETRNAITRRALLMPRACSAPISLLVKQHWQEIHASKVVGPRRSLRYHSLVGKRQFYMI